jgi:hypothetical protein
MLRNAFGWNIISENYIISSKNEKVDKKKGKGGGGGSNNNIIIINKDVYDMIIEAFENEDANNKFINRLLKDNKNASNVNNVIVRRKDLQRILLLNDLLNLNSYMTLWRLREEGHVKQKLKLRAISSDEEETIENEDELNMIINTLTTKAGFKDVLYDPNTNFKIILLNDSFLYFMHLKYGTPSSNPKKGVDSNLLAKVNNRHQHFLEKKIPELCIILSYIQYFMKKYGMGKVREDGELKDKYFHAIDFAGGNGMLGLFLALLIPNV